MRIRATNTLIATKVRAHDEIITCCIYQNWVNIVYLLNSVFFSFHHFIEPLLINYKNEFVNLKYYFGNANKQQFSNERVRLIKWLCLNIEVRNTINSGRSMFVYRKNVAKKNTFMAKKKKMRFFFLLLINCFRTMFQLIINV